MSNLVFTFVSLTIFVIATNSYKITREAVPVPIPAIKKIEEYKGPVFVIKETDDVKDPFIGLIVEGGIERIRPNRPLQVPYANLPLPVPYANLPANNESTPEMSEDTDYFAIIVTPETVAQSQFSRTTTITIPLKLLLTGVSAHPRMPWIMVLKRQNHFDYFNELMKEPKPINLPTPQRRRYKRDTILEHSRQFSGDKNYQLLYEEYEKTNKDSFCATILRDLIIINEVWPSNENDNVLDDPFGLKINTDTRNETKVNSIEEEYAIGTEYKPRRKST